MKITAVALCLAVLLTGCTGKRDEMDRAMGLRAKLLASPGCSFEAAVTADYGNVLHSFCMSCRGDNQGNLSFEVTEPETLAGITGTVGMDGGRLTFDGTALAFDLMADDQISPVSGPWILLKTLLGGCLTDCGVEGQLLRLAIDDSYADDALRMDIWLNEENCPVRGEILFDNRRIVTMDISDFCIL